PPNATGVANGDAWPVCGSWQVMHAMRPDADSDTSLKISSPSCAASLNALLVAAVLDPLDTRAAAVLLPPPLPPLPPQAAHPAAASTAARAHRALTRRSPARRPEFLSICALFCRRCFGGWI